MGQLDCEVRPNDVFTPPTGRLPAPPVVTLAQDLPFHDLDWTDFERLIFRLASVEDEVEDWQRYGRSGQAQEGIDIYARRVGGRYIAWQCKRYAALTAADVGRAVEAFAKGTWLDRCDRLVIATSARTDNTGVQNAVEAAAKRLLPHGVAPVLLGPDRLSVMLKERPEIVADFFGENWVRAFCGEQSLQMLAERGHRLDRSRLAELRGELHRFYLARFTTLDRGIFETGAGGALTGAASALHRYVVPDVEPIHWDGSDGVRPETLRPPDVSSNVGPTGDDTEASRLRSSPTTLGQEAARVRSPDWLVEGSLSVVLGEAGLGKSTLLRALSLDLVSGGQVFPNLSASWGSYVPVYLPFARWAHMASTTSRGVSLDEAVEAWLRMFSVSEGLIALVRTALIDHRLLLLVDGLDEWSNETAARTVLGQLDTVVRTRGIAAVVTGRPLGLGRLGALAPPWRTARLAALSEEQQRGLTYRLLDAPLPSVDGDGMEAKAHTPEQGAAVARAEEFLSDIAEIRGLQALAANPLLLRGLLHLKLNHLVLPHGRFAAHEELATLLLARHPEARARSAADLEPRFPPAIGDPEARRRVLGALAFRLRIDAPGSGIATLDARRVLVAALEDEDDQGLPSDKAREAASSLLAVNAETQGLLVEKAPGEVGFSHAIFEEYLAAVHLSGRPLGEQKAFIRDQVADPRWSNVILNLIRLHRRPSDVDELVRDLEEAPVMGLGRVTRDLVLSEIAFGEGTCPARLRRRHVATTLTAIETGPWMPARLASLGVALDGSGAGIGHEAIAERLPRWFPDTQVGRAPLYTAMASWPASPGLEDALLRALLNPGEQDGDAASQTMASVFGGDERIVEQLARHLREPREPGPASRLLYALGRGWPEHPDLQRHVDDARACSAPELRLTGVRLAVAGGRQTGEDRDFLLWCAEERSFAFYYLRGAIVEALINGWPGDPEIGELALRSWAAHPRRRDGMDEGVAASILLQGFPQHPGVLDLLVAELDTDGYAFRFTNHLSQIRTAFSRHPRLAEAIDAWMERPDSKARGLDTQISQACLISGSDNAKRKLIEQVAGGGRYVFWPLWALHEGWTLKDCELGSVVEAFIRRPPAEQQHASHLLPLMVTDRDRCRELLLEIARLPQVERTDFLVEGFGRLGVDHTDLEVVQALIGVVRERHGTIFSGSGGLIAHFGPAEPVKEFALSIIGQKGAPLAEMAKAFAADAGMQETILARARPLPNRVRSKLIDFVSRKPSASPRLQALLSQYVAETNPIVRASAEAGYHRRLPREERTSLQSLRRVASEFGAVGPDLDVVRGAAITAAIEGECLGEALAIASPEGGPVFSNLSFVRMGENGSLLASLLRKWKYLRRILGDDVIKGLVGDDGDRGYVWNQLAPELNGGSAARQTFLEYCSSVVAPLEPSSLRALARLAPHTALLRDHCLRAVRMHPGHATLPEYQRSVEAGTVLGTTFSADSEVGRRLEGDLETGSVGAVVGLTIGWPRSSELAAYRQFVEVQKVRLPRVSALSLLVVFGTTERRTSAILRTIDEITGDMWDMVPEVVAAVIRILRADEEVGRILLGRLSESDATASERASVPRLLATAGVEGEATRRWSEATLATSGETYSLRDVGLDLVAGEHRPVPHALLDVLLPYGPG